MDQAVITDLMGWATTMSSFQAREDEGSFQPSRRQDTFVRGGAAGGREVDAMRREVIPVVEAGDANPLYIRQMRINTATTAASRTVPPTRRGVVGYVQCSAVCFAGLRSLLGGAR